MPSVNPEILSWARETAGLSMEEAAEKLGIHDSHGVNAAQRLAAFDLTGKVNDNWSLIANFSHEDVRVTQGLNCFTFNPCVAQTSAEGHRSAFSISGKMTSR
jgi:hypothetical protein